MVDNLQMPKIEEVQNSIKKYGWVKTILFYIFVYYIPIIGLIILAHYWNSKDLEKKFTAFVSNQTQIIQQFCPNNPQVLGTPETPGPKNLEGVKASFNEKNWIIDNFRMDNDGFYCPTVKNFEFWSMWTKEEFPAQLTNLKIRVQIKPDNKKPPTLALTYGSYKFGLAPQPYYRLSVFDSDLKTIRLYNKDNKSQVQDWLSDTPDLKTEMTISIAPRVPDPKGRKVILNPSIKYAIENSDGQKDFNSQEEFGVIMPIVEMGDSTVKKQFGVGTRYGTCFKILALEYEI